MYAPVCSGKGLVRLRIDRLEPVVAASRLEGDVVDGKFRSVEHRREIALTYEILGKAVVRLSYGGMRLDFP